MGQTEYTTYFLKIECMEFHVSNELHVTVVSGCRAILWMHHVLFNVSPIVGPLACSQYFALVINTVINKAVTLPGQLWFSLRSQNKPQLREALPDPTAWAPWARQSFWGLTLGACSQLSSNVGSPVEHGSGVAPVFRH